MDTGDKTNEEAQRPQILAVDDNAYTLRIVKHTLEQAQYKVLTAVSGKEAQTVIAERGIPDLAVVDLHMPGGMSGFEFCHTVHQYSDLPVIMLTAVSEEQTLLEGLEKHAEDYIVKPFSPGELVVRVGRLLDRMGQMTFQMTPNMVVDGRLQIDFPQRQALVEGEPVSLTPTETKLLYILMRKAGHTVTTGYILRRLWPRETAYEDRLHVHLHRLRRKIEDHDPQSEAIYIVSERGAGYKFVSPAPSPE